MVCLDGFVDIHHHLAWGMDDGPQTRAQSMAMLEAASRDGIGCIIATAHATPGLAAFDMVTYLYRVEALNVYSAKQGLHVSVLPGAELMYTERAAESLRTGLVPSLANSEYVLVEFPLGVRFEDIHDACRSLANGGYIPIIAHAERYSCLTRRPGYIPEIKERFRARIQVNCSTIIGAKTRRAGRLLDRLHIDFVATDSHNTGARPACMQQCYCALAGLRGPRFAAALTGHNQRDIINLAIPAHRGDIHLEQV